MYNASNWDRKQHAADTEKRPKERDRKQNKERMQPRTAADHLGINVVRVNLLNHEQTENREHAMQRTRGDGRDREGRQHTEKRTEIGNDVEHTVEQSDDDRVIDLKGGQHYRGKKGDDQAVDHRALDEGGKHLVDFREIFIQKPVRALRKQHRKKAFPKHVEEVPIFEKVDRSDQTDKKMKHRVAEATQKCDRGLDGKTPLQAFRELPEPCRDRRGHTIRQKIGQVGICSLISTLKIGEDLGRDFSRASLRKGTEDQNNKAADETAEKACGQQIRQENRKTAAP